MQQNSLLRAFIAETEGSRISSLLNASYVVSKQHKIMMLVKVDCYVAESDVISLLICIQVDTSTSIPHQERQCEYQRQLLRPSTL